jgi:hypothetical protein
VQGCAISLTVSKSNSERVVKINLMFFSIKKVLAGRKNYFLIAGALAFAIFLKPQSVKLSSGQASTDVLFLFLCQQVLMQLHN